MLTIDEAINILKTLNIMCVDKLRESEHDEDVDNIRKVIEVLENANKR